MLQSPHRLSLLACLTALILFCVGCEQPEPLKIGFLGGLTGRAAGLGTDGRNGFLLAIEQMNAAGGVNGRQIEAVVLDNQMDTQVAPLVMEQLLQSGVAAIIGPMTSQMAVSSVPAINQAHTPMISPTVSTNLLIDQDDYFFRIYYTNAQAAAMLARRLNDDFKITRVAAIYDLSNRAYTEDWLQQFKTSFAKTGGQVVAAIPFEVNAETQFIDMTEQALAAAPEAILVLANAIDTALFCQQVSKRKSAVKLFATGWSYSDELLQFGGRAVEGLTLIQSANLNSREPEFLAFQQAFIERFHQAPNFPAVQAYDATRMTLEALSGTADGQDLKPALLASRYTGLQGEIRFNPYGERLNPPLFLARIVNGRFVTIAEH